IGDDDNFVFALCSVPIPYFGWAVTPIVCLQPCRLSGNAVAKVNLSLIH
nr:hypothetical protein [Tanacetum cinerariifolium]